MPGTLAAISAVAASTATAAGASAGVAAAIGSAASIGASISFSFGLSLVAQSLASTPRPGPGRQGVRAAIPRLRPRSGVHTLAGLGIWPRPNSGILGDQPAPERHPARVQWIHDCRRRAVYWTCCCGIFGRIRHANSQPNHAGATI